LAISGNSGAACTDDSSLRITLKGIANTEKLAQHPESEEQTQKHTAIHIMKNVGLTQDEIIQASFASKRIERFVHVNRDTGAADYLLFRYKNKAWKPDAA